MAAARVRDDRMAGESHGIPARWAAVTQPTRQMQRAFCWPSIALRQFQEKNGTLSIARSPVLINSSFWKPHLRTPKSWSFSTSDDWSGGEIERAAKNSLADTIKSTAAFTLNCKLHDGVFNGISLTQREISGLLSLRWEARSSFDADIWLCFLPENSFVCENGPRGVR